MIYRLENYFTNETYYVKSYYNEKATVRKMKDIAILMQDNYEKEEIDYSEDCVCRKIYSEPDCWHITEITEDIENFDCIIR